MNLFSKEAINCGRQEEVDLLRGYTSINLVIVHVGLYLGNNIDKGLWTFCDIIGSEFAAPVFMALMGISIIYSRHNTPGDLLKRGIRLFLSGYTLSLFRSLLPFLIFVNIDEWTSVEAFFVVDILQFAGLSLIFLAILRKLKLSSVVIFLISLAMVAFNQYLELPESAGRSSKLLTGLINLFYPITDWSCFPFFIWFCFPASGLLFGDLLTHCCNKKKLYSILLPTGFLGVLYVYSQFHFLYPDYTSYYWGNNFYYMGLKNVLLTMLFVCFALSFWFFAGKVLPGFLRNFFIFLSRNLNTYYVISWIIISALIHAQAICNWKFSTITTIAVSALVIMACAVSVRLWLFLKKQLSRQKDTVRSNLQNKAL